MLWPFLVPSGDICCKVLASSVSQGSDVTLEADKASGSVEACEHTICLKPLHVQLRCGTHEQLYCVLC